MANSSSTVSTTDVITAAQYNDLRTDAIGPYGAARNFPDNIKTTYGTSTTDGEIYSDNTDWIFDAVGGFDIKFKVSGTTRLTITSSGFTLTGNQLFDDNEKIIMGTGSDAEIYFDGTDLIINPDAVGSGNLKVGASLVINASESLFFGAIEILADSSGTTTLKNIDALDATTEATIEAAIDTLANLTAAAALVTVGTISTGVWSATDVAIAAGGTGSSTASGARTNLGLAIGSNVQAWDADLDTYAGKTPPSGAVVGTTDSQTLTNKTITAGGNTISGLTHGSEVDNPSSGVHGAVGTIVGTSDSQTLTNKTIAMANNTVSGTASLFNTALTDDTFAFISNTLAVFAATTSLQLLGVISDETGTGSLMFGTAPTVASPTITTSPSATGSTWDNLGTVTTVDINGGTIDGATIGGASAGAGTFTTLIGTTIDGSIGSVTPAAAVITTLTITSFAANWTNASRTVADLGIVTTVDINGGSIDGAIIGAASAAAATVTTLNAGNTFISNGNALVIGHTVKVSEGGANNEFQMLGTANDDSGILLSLASTVDTRVAQINFVKNANATIGTYSTIVADNELLGHMGFYGTDGVDADTLSASFSVEVDDASPAAGDIGAAFVWKQMPGGGGAIAETMRISAAGDLIQAGGVNYIGDTANANMTVGMTINQGANDNEALALKSSDVAHAMTGLAEADTWGTFTKVEAASGGLNVKGYKDGDGVASGALQLSGVLGETAETSDTTSSIGVVNIVGQITDAGTGATVVADAGNVLTIRNNVTTRMLVKGDGAFHVTNRSAGAGDVVAAALDDHHDVMMIRDHQRYVHNDVGIAISKWDEAIGSRQDELIREGVLSSTGEFRVVQRYQDLLGGAIWQNYERHMSLVERVDDLTIELESATKQLAALTA